MDVIMEPPRTHGHPYYVRSDEETELLLDRAREIRPDPMSGMLRVSPDICGTLVGPLGKIPHIDCDPCLPPNSMVFGDGPEA